MNLVRCDFRVASHLAKERFESGFTLVELILIIIILGVMSVYAAPRLFNSAGFTARGFHDETLAYLRFAHQIAIAQRRTVCVAFTPNSLTLSIASASAATQCDTALLGPKGEIPATLTAKSGAAFRVQPSNFNFDALGRPVSTSGGLMTSLNIEISGAFKPLTVEADTGFVHE